MEFRPPLSHVLVVLASLACVEQARARERCDHVVSYFLFPYQGSRMQEHEWWIFDPGRGSNARFLSLPGGFEGVRWDTSFSTVFFSSGDSLYRIEWKLGAKPRLISRLPDGQANERSWWFNPDSACWQMLRILGQTEADSPYYSRYWGDLWQSSRDGVSWRRVRADSLDCEDEQCQRWRWMDGTRLGWQAPTVTLEDLESETQWEAWGDRAVPMDTSTVSLVDTDAYSGWNFLRLRSSSRKGVAFQMHPAAPEANVWVKGPLYLVDLDRQTKTLIPTTHSESLTESLFAERCELLLVPGPSGAPLVISATSGRVVFSQPWNSNGAVWVRAPGR